MPTKEGEIKLPAIKLVDKDFLFEIEGALKAFETYLFNEFGSEVQFPYVRMIFVFYITIYIGCI